MKLSEYLPNHGDKAKFARKIKVPPALISQWSGGVREVPTARCCEIEKESGGKVTRKDLRPHDFHKHWPDLVEEIESVA